MSCLLGLLAFGLSAVAGQSGLRHLPIGAIPYSEFLSKAEFDARFPSETPESVDALPRGWYVTYQHEQLSYWFGPVRFRSTAEDYEQQLRRIVESARQARPDLENYSIAVREPPREDREARPEETTPPEARSPGSPSTEPPPPPSLLQRLLGIFRRG